jgi:hypothetical protein
LSLFCEAFAAVYEGDTAEKEALPRVMRVLPPIMRALPLVMRALPLLTSLCL